MFLFTPFKQGLEYERYMVDYCSYLVSLQRYIVATCTGLEPVLPGRQPSVIPIYQQAKLDDRAVIQ